MKSLYIALGCLIGFCLGTVFHSPELHAQSSKHKVTFYELTLCKSRPGQDPFKLEHEIWKPVQRDLIKRGDLISWNVLVPVFAGSHAYNYMTLEEIPNIGVISRRNISEQLAKHWGKEKVDKIWDETMNARDSVGGELWQVVDSTDSEQ